MPEPLPTQLLALWAVFAGAGGAWLARRYAIARSMLDQPGARRSHSLPTPRGGGVGIVAAMVGAGLLLVAGGRIDATPGLAFVASLLMVAGVGWWDDHRDLSAAFRLLVHLAAGAVAALGVLGVPAGMAEVLALALATLWLAGMLNAWNFMDGINGIASGQAVVVGLALWLVPGMLSAGWALLAMVLAVACAAFLPFNLPRARIFLGDVGSGAIGFSIGVLLLTAAAASPPASWPLVLLLCVVFLVDAGATLAGRVVAGRRWWRPHREHAYQWAVRRGCSHFQVASAYALLGLLAAIMGGWLWPGEGPVGWWALAGWAVGLLVLRWWLKNKWLDSARGRRG